MKISSAFASAYLRATDLPPERPVMVTMEKVVIEDVGGKGKSEDQKPVLYFAGKEKGLVLNKTNSNAIAALYGDETDGWSGKPIQIFATETDFQGDRVACIRIKQRMTVGDRKVAPAPTQAPPRPAATVPPIGEDTFNEDDIPFAWEEPWKQPI